MSMHPRQRILCAIRNYIQASCDHQPLRRQWSNGKAGFALALGCSLANRRATGCKSKPLQIVGNNVQEN